MRQLKNVTRIFLIAIVSYLVVFCGNQANNKINIEKVDSSLIAKGKGQFRLKIHDAPANGNITAINITVDQVKVVAIDGKVIDASSTPKRFNLLDLAASNPLELVFAELPTGMYTQIRLIFNNNQTIVVNGVEKPLKTPSANAGQSGFKLDGAFEITEGLIYTMTVDFNPNTSIVYNPGPDTYVLKPVMRIVSNTMINGLFSVRGLIGNELVVSELNPDGSFKMKTSADNRLEFFGNYFFNQSNHILTLIPKDTLCATCNNVRISLSANIVKIPKIFVETWNNNKIEGFAVNDKMETLSSVLFERTNSYVVSAPKPFTNLVIEANYPIPYNGKYGLIVASPTQDGPPAQIVDIQEILNGKALFKFHINYDLLPGGSRDFQVRMYVVNAISDLDINIATLQLNGISGFSPNFYVISIPVSDKEVKSIIVY